MITTKKFFIFLLPVIAVAAIWGILSLANDDTTYQEGLEYYNRNEYSEAVKCFREAAEQGNADAQYKLGYCYYYGIGTKQDYSEAVSWFREAAKQEDVFAQICLGHCYDNGQGVEQDETEAAKWYRKAAEQGNAYGQNCLGICYNNGFGVKQDHAEAVKWYQKQQNKRMQGRKRT